MSATFYVKTDCPYCAALRDELDAKGTEYNEINVKKNPEVIPELLKLTGGRRIVPVLVSGGEVSIAPAGG